MSYASIVKQELTGLDLTELSDVKSELKALVRMNGAISIVNQKIHLNLVTENASIERRMYKLIKYISDVDIEAGFKSSEDLLNKKKIYMLTLSEGAKEFLLYLNIINTDFDLNELGYDQEINTDADIRAYLRGAFLAGGSINNPERSQYHLEIYSLYAGHNDQILQFFNKYGLNAHSAKRRSGYIVYLKEADKISDFLQLVGATNAMLKFEDVRVVRDVRNSVNRLVNYETANINKISKASIKQVNDIKVIEHNIGLDKLPEELRTLAELRLNNREASLQELSELIQGASISKSGINHRFRKISEVAQPFIDGRNKTK